MTKIVPALVAGSLLLLGPTASPAEEAPQYSAALNECMATGEAAKGVTTAMAHCLGAELKRQDTALNAAYKRAMEGMDEPHRTSLRSAQRAWIKFRDSKCAAEASSGGTMDLLNGPSCLIDTTIARTAELQKMAGDEPSGSTVTQAAVYVVNFKAGESVLFLGEGQATRHGDVVNVPSAIVFQKPQHVDAGEGSIFITNYDFDCSKRQMREESGSALNRQGFVIDSWSQPEPWRPVGQWTDQSVSNEQVMFMVTCQNDLRGVTGLPSIRDISQAAQDYFDHPR